ncbi:hypothetical protein NF212_11185 [Parasalinivibrio latis]|uniref:hypothetical protein n=1 Tax=Parasalinivibrio latis TaxID=2952610 RepID=UPI0030DF06B2
MEIKLHSNASTTPRTRKYIKNSDKSDTELASELSISIETVKKWRNRSDVYDKSHRPNVIHRRLSPEQEWLIVYLRFRLSLSLDELLEVSQLLVNRDLSRAVLNRCLKKYQVPRMAKPASTSFGKVIVDKVPLPDSVSSKAICLLVFTECFTTHISFALVSEKSESTRSHLVDFLKSVLPYSVKEMVLPDDEFVISLATSLGVPWSTHKDATAYSLDTEEPADFNQPIDKFLNGEFYDARLGLPSVLLCYEDLLNKRVLRNRLKNMAPHAYCKQIAKEKNT